MTRDFAAAWDAEYAAGRYEAEEPVPFVYDIISSVRCVDLQGQTGLYIGCGNGRNFLPLRAAGLDLVGLDISRVALDQLAARLPERRDRLLCGDLSALPPAKAYAFVIGIQVFQHGDRETAHRHLRAALARVEAGGLFCLRVNSADTDIHFEHTIVSRSADGGRTVLYHDGPKRGLHVHFFGAAEVTRLMSSDFDPVMSLRVQRTQRPRNLGQWSQWEGIWRRKK